MARRSDWRRRWASLSALASAALASSGGSGEAAIIYQPTPGFSIPGSLSLPGDHGILLFQNYTRFATNTPLNSRDVRGVFMRLSYSGRVVARGSGFRAIGTGKGFNFNMVGGGIDSSPTIASRIYRGARWVGTARFHSGSGKGVTRPLRFAGGSSSLVEHVFGRRYFTTSKGRKSTSISFSAYVHRSRDSPPSYSKEYALFRFNVGPQTDYGWL